MDNYRLPTQKSNERAKEDAAKSSWTLSYRIKGLTAGLIAAFAYNNFYPGEYDVQIIIGFSILGIFLGWLVGSFFYTKS